MAQKERKKAKKIYIFWFTYKSQSNIFTVTMYIIPRGHKVDYLEKYFELDIRDLDRRLWASCPEAFAAYLDENRGS